MRSCRTTARYASEARPSGCSGSICHGLSATAAAISALRCAATVQCAPSRSRIRGFCAAFRKASSLTEPQRGLLCRRRLIHGAADRSRRLAARARPGGRRAGSALRVSDDAAHRGDQPTWSVGVPGRSDHSAMTKGSRSPRRSSNLILLAIRVLVEEISRSAARIRSSVSSLGPDRSAPTTSAPSAAPNPTPGAARRRAPGFKPEPDHTLPRSRFDRILDGRRIVAGMGTMVSRAAQRATAASGPCGGGYLAQPGRTGSGREAVGSIPQPDPCADRCVCARKLISCRSTALLGSFGFPPRSGSFGSTALEFVAQSRANAFQSFAHATLCPRMISPAPARSADPLLITHPRIREKTQPAYMIIGILARHPAADDDGSFNYSRITLRSVGPWGRGQPRPRVGWASRPAQRRALPQIRSVAYSGRIGDGGHGSPRSHPSTWMRLNEVLQSRWSGRSGDVPKRSGVAADDLLENGKAAFQPTRSPLRTQHASAWSWV